MGNCFIARSLFMSIAAGGVIGCGSSHFDSSNSSASDSLPRVLVQKQKCSSLAGLIIPANAFGLPTSGAKIQAAVDVADLDAAQQSREYCLVTGSVLPVDSTASPINFEVNLPKKWNQKALQYGGGGLNGTVATGTGQASQMPTSIPTPLARGYVTFGSDSGHSTSENANAAFALNHEELLNFAQHSIKKTVDVAKHLTNLMYGQKPKYTYFIGGSQGGTRGASSGTALSRRLRRGCCQLSSF